MAQPRTAAQDGALGPIPGSVSIWAGAIGVARHKAVDRMRREAQLERWAQLHIARAELLRRLGHDGEAADAYRAALDLEPAAASRAFIARRMREITRAGK